MNKFMLIVVSGLLLFGCANNQNNNNSPFIDNTHTTENSLSWGGIYKGEFPCADCEGINTTLTLNYNGTFILEEAYKKGIVTFMPQAMTGKIEWDKKNTSVIHLKSGEDHRAFFVAEGYVEAYGSDGQPIESQLDYTLKLVESFEWSN